MDPNTGAGRKSQVALSDIDRRLLQHCLAGEPRSWNEFVDRFIGLVLHVIGHTCNARGLKLPSQEREDLVAEVFLAIVRDDLAVLRRFRGTSSLATYLTVVARRVVIRKLGDWQRTRTLQQVREEAGDAPAMETNVEQQVSDEEELERLLGHLNGNEAQVVRMYHLEGKSYREISDAVGIPENTIGPTLSRARSKMRQASADSTIS